MGWNWVKYADDDDDNDNGDGDDEEPMWQPYDSIDCLLLIGWPASKQ